MTSLTKILQTYTHITSAIKSCKTLAQLDTCDNMITSLNMHNDRPDLHEWIKAIDETYLKKREELKKPITAPSVTSMRNVVEHVDLHHDGEGGYYYQDEQPSDIC